MYQHKTQRAKSYQYKGRLLMFINSLARIKAEALATWEAETGPNFY